jgi:hypothetical protein
MAEHEPHNPVDFERSDADPAIVTRLGVGVAVTVVIASFVVLGLFRALQRSAQSSQAPVPLLASHERDRQPPAPRLQVQPFADLLTLHAHEQQVLESTGWVDRAKGVAHIPIEQAMKIVAERGLPHWPPAPSPAPSAGPAAAKPGGVGK